MMTDVRTQLWDTASDLGVGADVRLRILAARPWEKPDASPEAFDRAMGRVDHAILHGFVSRHLEASISLQQVVRHVRRQPGRYLGFAGVDPMDDHALAAVDEARRFGMLGITISPANQDYHPAHTRAMDLYEKCQSLGLPVFVIPALRYCPGSKLDFSQPYLFDEVALSFPELRLVIAQMGHPFLEQTLALLAKHPQVYAEVSDVVERPWQLYNALLSAHQQGVMHQLLLGSNFPFNTPERAIDNLYSVNQYAKGTNLPTVPREAIRSIVEHDALACLGLDPTQGIPPADGPDAATSGPPSGSNPATTPAETSAKVDLTKSKSTHKPRGDKTRLEKARTERKRRRGGSEAAEQPPAEPEPPAADAPAKPEGHDEGKSET